MILAQINAPDWAQPLMAVGGIIAVSAALITLIVWYRNNGDK